MKKQKNALLNGLETLAMAAVKGSVNSACALFIYQSKVPAAAKKFRKF